MHEAAIAKSILDIADGRARSQEGASVDTVRVRIGAFRNVDPDSLDMAFEGLRAQYESCRSATLEKHMVESKATCHKRGHLYTPLSERGFRCPLCGSGMSELVAGEELEVIGCILSLPAQKENDHARIS